ncbi:TonB family protein [Marinicella litoralis]|uniref:TonB family protein n=1 Tax=Marinicella litoralis TaxID=644220 RepID=A0A4R6XQI8_9GAMM|nr:TonB family protein [Marinicella litoralis]TDR18528.1 TonB family protein [Marinicella litoralis]
MLKKINCCILLLLCVFVVSAQNDDEKNEEPSKRPSWSSGLPERQTTNDLSKPDFKPEIDNEIELDMSDFGVKPRAEIDIGLPISSEIPAKSDATSELPVTDEESQLTVDEIIVVEEPIEAPAVVAEPVETELFEDVDAKPVEQTEVVNNNLFDEEEPIVDEVVPAEVEKSIPAELIVEENNATTPIEPNTEATVDQLVDNDSEVAVDLPTAIETLDDEAIDATPVEEVVTGTPAEAVEYNWTIVKQTPVKYPVKAAMENLEGWVDVEVTINPSGEVVSASVVKSSRKGRVFGKSAVQSVNDWLFEPPSNSGITSNMTRIYTVEFNL